MKIHIVGANESLKDIARKYDIPIEDIIKNNLHISNVKHILPGMKLKLPILAEVAQEKFRENTINIQEYYPTIDDYNKFEKEQLEDEEIKEETQVGQTEQPQPAYQNSQAKYQQQNQPYMMQGQQPYTQPQYPYYQGQQPLLPPQQFYPQGQNYPYPPNQQPLPYYFNPYQPLPTPFRTDFGLDELVEAVKVDRENVKKNYETYVKEDQDEWIERKTGESKPIQIDLRKKVD